MKNYNKLNEVSKEMCKRIFMYYRDIYRSYEIKSVTEIASELEISANSVRDFLAMYISNSDKDFSDIEMVIMLSTRFSTRSIYYERQQQLYGEIITQRMQIKEQKDRRERISQMVKKRSSEYMNKKNCI